MQFIYIFIKNMLFLRVVYNEIAWFGSVLYNCFFECIKSGLRVCGAIVPLQGVAGGQYVGFYSVKVGMPMCGAGPVNPYFLQFNQCWKPFVVYKCAAAVYVWCAPNLMRN